MDRQAAISTADQLRAERLPEWVLDANSAVLVSSLPESLRARYELPSAEFWMVTLRSPRRPFGSTYYVVIADGIPPQLMEDQD